jgi:hypothetical protein
MTVSEPPLSVRAAYANATADADAIAKELNEPIAVIGDFDSTEFLVLTMADAQEYERQHDGSIIVYQTNGPRWMT